MKQVICICLFLILFVSLGVAVEYGHCQFEETSANGGQITGTALFTSSGGLVTVNITVDGITVNTDALHGVHIHQYGDLSDTSGTSVGSHFDPLTQPHGCPENATRHLGDTGNWEVSDGSISQNKTLDLLTMVGTNSIIGRAVIIHANTDNCVEVASSGSRLGRCVIGIANHTLNTAVNSNEAITKAICVLRPTSGNSGISGIVLFNQTSPTSPTLVTAKIYGLTPGSLHGFHIHEWGDLSSSAGTNTGFHYNPYNSNHGIPNSIPRHLGDMGNVFFYDDDDIAYYQFSHDLISLNGNNNVIGRGLILHSDKDNCSQPLGAAGSRIAQCVIGIANPATVIEDFPTNVLSTQDTSLCPAVDSSSEGSSSDHSSEEVDSLASTLRYDLNILFALIIITLTAITHLL